MRFVSNWSLKFNPKIVTSYRSHGKWGDLIICILPISWCLNILTNSTTLLKILEWQSEANYFTVRVRGKQWYWVYKFDVKSMISELNSDKLFKKLGNNYKSSFSLKDTTYLFNELINNFWKEDYADNTFTANLPEIVKNPITIEKSNLNSTYFTPKKIVVNYDFKNFFKKHKNNNFGETINNKNFSFFKGLDYDIYTNEFFVNNEIFWDQKIDVISSFNSYKMDVVINRYWRNNIKVKNEIEIKKALYSDEKSIILTKYSYNKIKTFSKNFYGILKQKSLTDWIKSDSFNMNFIDGNLFASYYTSLTQDSNKTVSHDNVQLINNSRLLKVNRILVLPTNLHINIITNSFDVIHSWFIPGLGLKMDCVPGRSTHHTLYIDIPGMYYGQCAEVCGRFHHHMPIRVCAMTYDHYLVWWYHMGSFMMVSDNIDTERNTFKLNITEFINK